MDPGVADSEDDDASADEDETLNEFEPHASGSNSANNTTGKNQHQSCPSKNDPEFLRLITLYHRQTTNTTVIAKLLFKENRIKTSPRNIARRLVELKLGAGGKTERRVPSGTVDQLIIDQLDRDPTGRSGPATIKQEIARKTGVHVLRRTVKERMDALDPEAARRREPTAREIIRAVLTALGPHYEWSGDGHDKLLKYGFAIWGIRDKWSRYWLGLWVLPNNRKAIVIAYLWLTVVKRCGGIPEQTTTDCGSENTVIYGLANALKLAFTESQSRAHVFMRSVHNVVIERGWLDLRNTWGFNAAEFFERGVNVYDETIELHRLLALWIWPNLLQRELDDARDKMNKRRQRKQKEKALPSGVSPNILMSLYADHGGVWCLHPVDMDIVQEIMDDLLRMEDPFDWGVPAEFSARCEQIYLSLNIGEVTMQNVWTVFSAMLAELERNE